MKNREMKYYLFIFALFAISLVNAQGTVIPAGGGVWGNTDAQQLSLSGNTLTLQNGGTVDLSPYLDNTDGQTVTDLSLSGNTLSITLSGGNTQNVDLSSLSGGGPGDMILDTPQTSTGQKDISIRCH